MRVIPLKALVVNVLESSPILVVSTVTLSPLILDAEKLKLQNPASIVPVLLKA